MIYFFSQASFDDDARIAFLTLLEYEPNEVREKIAEKTGSKPANAQAQEGQSDFPVSDRIDAITDDMANLETNEDSNDDAFDAIGKRNF